MSEPFRTALLLSMPQLQDPNFARTVVLLCEYGPEGAFGLVLNRPTEMPASAMVRLDPANRQYEAQRYDPRRVQIQGRLAGLIRRY